jgi:AcrR family transcriptional regulator
MVSASIPAPAARRRAAKSDADHTRFERRLSEILGYATDVFCDKGYEGASMRDLSRATGMSLAGLYYYFESKERLLYMIQRHTFMTITGRVKSSSQRFRSRKNVFASSSKTISNISWRTRKAMKVLSHEDDALRNGFRQEVSTLKREYYRICLQLLEDLKRAQSADFTPRIAVLALFGMMNWIYTWHNPKVDSNAAELAREMGDIFLSGVTGSGHGPRKRA